MSDPVIRCMKASDDVRLHFRHWTTESPHRGTVVAVHGIQSHSGWYVWSSERMAAAGYDVYFADRRGSGLNGVARGHADHGQRLVNDVRQLIYLARREQKDSSLPLTLLAVSWGGKIAAALAAAWPQTIDRLALLYPGLQPKITPSLWQSLALRLARRFDVRSRGIDIPLTDPAVFTSIPEHQQFIAEDPLTIHRVTSGFVNAGRDLDRIVQGGCQGIVVPTLLMLAGQDQIIDNDETSQLVARFGCVHQTTIRYPNAQHTLEFDADREQFAEDLIAWLGGCQRPGHSGC